MIGGICGPRGISDGEVQAATNKCWREWMAILAAWDTQDKSFRPVFNYLLRRYRLKYYWAQAVAVQYVMKRSYTDDLSQRAF